MQWNDMVKVSKKLPTKSLWPSKVIFYKSQQNKDICIKKKTERICSLRHSLVGTIKEVFLGQSQEKVTLILIKSKKQTLAQTIMYCGLRIQLSWQNSCLACAKPWVRFLAWNKYRVVVLTYNVSTGEVEEGDQKLNIILGYTERLRTERPCL